MPVWEGSKFLILNPKEHNWPFTLLSLPQIEFFNVEIELPAGFEIKYLPKVF